MNSWSACLRRLASRAMPLLAVLVVCGSYFFYSISTLSAYFNDRSMRSLGLMNRQIRDRAKSLATLLEGRARSTAPSDEATETKLSADLRIYPCPADQEDIELKSVNSALTLVRRVTGKGLPPICAEHRFEVSTAIRDDFDLILVAGKDGKVLYQDREPGGLRFTSVTSLFRNQETRGSRNGEDNQPPSAAAELPRVTTGLEREIAGSNYKVFVQPLSPAGCVVIGMRQSKKMWTSVAPTSRSLAVSSLLLLIVILSWPLQKLWYMRPSEPVRRSDVHCTVFCILVISVAVTMMLLFFHCGRALSEFTERQLQALSARISANLFLEISLAERQLDVLTKKLLGSNWRRDAGELRKKNILEKLSDDEKLPVSFESAFWMDGDGMQRVRWSPRSQAPILDLRKSRNYFQDALHNHLFSLPLIRGGRLAIQSLVSWTTAQNLAVIAKPVENAAPLRVAAIGVNLRSVINPVLPADFGFAVIQPDGLVLFHSDETRNLSESFFEECSPCGPLRAAVERRAAASFSGTYHGRLHRLLLRPLEGTGIRPWTLIVFRDQTATRSTEIQVLLTAAVLLLVYLVLVSPFLFWCCRTHFRLWRESADPEARQRLYSMLAVTNLVLSVILLIGLAASESYAGFWLSVLVGIAASVWGAFAARGALRIRLPGRGFRGSLMTSFLLYVAAVGVLPCVAFVKFAGHSELLLSVRSGQWRLIHAVERRSLRLEEELNDTGGAGQLTPTGLAMQGNAADFYHGAFFDSRLLSSAALACRSETPATANPAEGLVRRLATIPDLLLGSGERVSNVFPADPAWRWCLPENGEPRERRLLRIGFGYRPESNIEIRSRLPSYAPERSGALWLGILGLLAGLGLWIRLAARRMLYLDDTEIPQISPFALLPREPIACNMLLIGKPWSGKSRLLDDRTDTARIDMAKPGWMAAAEKAEPDKVVVLDHFEDGICGAEASHARLSVLEDLLFAKRRRVVIISTIEPLSYLFEGGGASLGETPSPSELDRWTRVMRCFRKFQTPDPPLEDFGQVLSKYSEHDPALAAWMRNECRSDSRLQGIARQLAQSGLKEATWTADEFARQFAERAEGYYSALWTSCAWREMLLMIHLARHGLANAKNRSIVAELVRRGLLRKNHRLLLMNETFAGFVRNAERPSKVLEWEREGADSPPPRTALWAFGLLIGVVLFLTQQDLLARLVASVTALLGAIKSGLGLFSTDPVQRAGVSVGKQA